MRKALAKLGLSPPTQAEHHAPQVLGQVRPDVPDIPAQVLEGTDRGITATTLSQHLPQVGGDGDAGSRQKLGHGLLKFQFYQGFREAAAAFGEMNPSQVSQSSYWDAVYAHALARDGQDQARSMSMGGM